MKEASLKVSILTHTPEPENVVALSARLCYSPVGIEELKEKLSDNDKDNLINLLINSGHLSPFEHASFTFAVEGISRACSHQLVRHRIASYSQQSQRYVSEEKGFDYIIPDTIKKDSEIQSLFIEAMKKSHEYYCKILHALEKQGLKGELARQDARFVLPNAAETKIVITMNARELLHFFKVRCCNRAQWEIRELATEMLKLVKKIAPRLFKNAGPACITGKCPEGKFSCGEIEKVRKKFKSL
ncbi:MULTISPECIES: FAD-dependent thymidylate synthase [Thermodesulfovibrio]|uniref:Flavin-dependent thymidylate synthase n=2 Tax=Thermodesulfovibrio yellowstonii TaxID=28262 RepID=B5YKN7_THEYD|nr:MULTISPECIES: FAD-dependent thymidylate synthase [Thermodesulfovibrio]ACI21576.1 thymidylate synthase, flavin-dependent [Thermodesulfovibrio yellowstonii DSM 11347]MDI6864259.1 FAD-dependent thymidylate synthase [Thermodesulfovibrio yellowstonii]GLI53522.1 flavin-dependent thymidylate synthase [Thermodesulfovibrio islandicus]